MTRRRFGADSLAKPAYLPTPTPVVSSMDRSPKAIIPHIRWMIRSDMPQVLAIEGSSFDEPWSEEDFIRCLRQRNCIGMVAENAERMFGYMVYELHKSRISLLNLAVAPDMRRQRIGESLLHRLTTKLTDRRPRLLVPVSEGNLDAHLWLKACGLIATQVMRDYYPNRDAYLFEAIR